MRPPTGATSASDFPVRPSFDPSRPAPREDLIRCRTMDLRGRKFVASPGSGRGVTIVRSHPDLSDPSTRLLMPTTEEGTFPPFDRFADTVANARVQRGLHEHLAEEVVEIGRASCRERVESGGGAEARQKE